jgi:hypothetical protein
MKIPMKKGKEEEEFEVTEDDEATTGEASTTDSLDDGVCSDTSESMVTPVKNLMKSFGNMEMSPVKDVIEGIEDMVVTPQPKPVQYGLEKFWKTTPSKLENMPALAARDERLKNVVKDGHALKKVRGRPSKEMKALEEARKRGELMIVATLDQFNAAVRQQAEEMKKQKRNCFAEKGGRPATREWTKDLKTIVGFESPDMQSNRRRQGAVAERRDESAGTKLKIAEHMKALKQKHACEASWKKECVKTYGRQWITLKKILHGENEWRNRMKSFKLGFGSTGTTAAKGTCSKGGRWLKKGGTGARMPGAGRKDKFAHLKLQVRAWLEKERSRCHHVDKVDLLEEFIDCCQLELELVEERLAALNEDDSEKQQNEETKDEGSPELKVKTKKSMVELLQIINGGDCEVSAAPGFEGMLTSEEHVKQLSHEELEDWQKELESRVEALKNSPKYRETFQARLLQSIGGKLMQPGRMSTLSMEEEEAGVKATWKELDAALWLAAFGSEEDLLKVVASPAEFVMQREKLIVGFSDQIPVWVKIGRGKQVYCENELKKRKNTGDFLKLQADRQAVKVLKDKEAAEEDGEQKEAECEDEYGFLARAAEEEAAEKKDAAEEIKELAGTAAEKKQVAAEKAEEKKEVAAEKDEEKKEVAAEEAEEKKLVAAEEAEEHEDADEEAPPLVDEEEWVELNKILVEDPNAGGEDEDNGAVKLASSCLES